VVAESRVMPMFPLGTVLFPHALLPLHVFEARYRLMTRRVMASDQQFGVVLIERGSEVGGGDTRFDVGTIARIVRASELPDGRFALSTVGLSRFRVVEWLPDDPYPQAEIVAVADVPAELADTEGRARVVTALAEVYDLARRLDARVPAPPELAEDPLQASYEASSLAPVGPLDAQRLLAAERAGARLGLLEELLRDRADELRARLANE
jgi:Lon protease-like protein